MLDKIVLLLNEVKEQKGEVVLKEVDVNTSLRRDFGFDSLDLALVTAKIEDQFDIDIFEHGVIDKVGEILAILENR